MSDTDIGRIKRNIAKMIDMGAPEADIDAYIQEEGVTLQQLQQSRGKPSASSQTHTGGLTPRASHGGDNPDHIIDAKMAFIAKALGVDIDTPLTPSQLQAFRDAYVKTEGSSTNNVGNLKNPGGNGFQTFDTPEAGTDAIDAQIRRDYNRGQVSIRQLIEGYKIGEQLQPPSVKAVGEEAPPEQPQEQTEGQEDPVPPEQDPKPAPQKPKEPSDFRMPKSWGEFGQGLAQGTGDVVEGLADIPGVVVDPINTLIGRALGYKDYTADFGKTVRHGLGLPDSQNHLSSEIIKGASSGLGTSGAARLIAKVGTGPVSQALREFSSTPVRDAVGGATGALGADAGQNLAEAADLGPTGQMVASTVGGLAGGMAGYGAGTLAHNAKPEVRAENFAKAQASKDPRAAQFAAEFVADLKKTHETVNRGLIGPNPRAPLDIKTINDVIDGYSDQVMEHVKQLGLSKSEELRLRNALSRKHSLPQDEIDALRGSVAGDAVADTIEKTQIARRLTPEIARDPSALTKIGQVVSTGLDFVPGVPGIVGRGVRWATKATAGDAEAARVHAAKRLLDKQRGYQKLGELVGPSGQRESSAALRQASDDASTMKELDDIFAARDKEQARAEASATRAKAQDVNAAWSVRQEKGPTPLQRAKAKMSAFDLAETQAARAKQAQEDAMWNGSTTVEAGPFDAVPGPKSQTNDEIAGWNNILKNVRNRRAAEQARIKATTPKLDFTPPKPPKEAAAPKPKKVDPAQAAIDDAIAQGIPGDSGVQNAFANRLGIDPKDLPAVLDHVEQQLPADLKPEIDRIRWNYPTQNKRIGSVIGGRMGKAVEELGITPKTAESPTPKAPVPVDEAAQARLEGATPPASGAKQTASPELASTPPDPAAQARLEAPAPKDAPTPAPKAPPKLAELQARLDEVDPVQVTLGDGSASRASEVFPEQFAPGTKDGDEVAALRKQIADLQSAQSTPPTIRQIDRPQQWAEGKNRYVSQANSHIGNLQGDITLGSDTLNALRGIPEQVRDNFKTTADATDFIESQVVPHLESEGVNPNEIGKVKGYLYDIAGSKPYATREAYDAGTRAMPRGRPRKQN